MSKATYNDRAYASFAAAVPANLVGKEGYLVELVAGAKTIQLYTATGGVPPLGVLMERLEGDTNWSVRLLGTAATFRAVCGGNIAANGQVKANAGGTIVAATAGAGNPTIGFLLDGVAHVANDIVEVRDFEGLTY
jgi:hypothetical protein